MTKFVRMLVVLGALAFAVYGVSSWLGGGSEPELASQCAPGSVVVHTGDDTTICVPPR